ncbi:MAG: CAP domain-containing protein [Gaiella sp.]|nr:CAP domain-containing protein [Gaiella sp.]
MRTVVVLAASLLSAGALVATSAAGQTAETAAVTRAPSLEDLLLRQINDVRAAHGLGTLTISPALARSAAAHSRSMATYGYFAHTSRDGASFSERIRRSYAPRSGAWTVGENLAMFGSAAPTPVAIVDAWLASPPHRANLLRGTFREAGIGIMFNDAAGGVFGGQSTWIVTLDFGRR